MISINQLDAASASASLIAERDREIVNLVLSFADFSFRLTSPISGETTDFWKLKKALPGYPVGFCLTLEELHFALFPKGIAP